MVIGGPAVSIAETMRHLNTAFQFCLVTGEPLPDEKDASYLLDGISGIEVIKLPQMKRSPSFWRDVRSYRALKKIIRRVAPDVVHTHGAKPGLLGRLAAVACKVPVILHTYHGHIFHSYFNRLVSLLVIKTERWLARKTTRIIAISPHLQQELSARYAIAPPGKIVLLPLLLDLEKFEQEPEALRLRFRKKYLLEEEEIAIGIVGRITAVKNMQFFLEAALLLKQQTTVHQLRFFIIGDGEEKNALEHWFSRHPVSYTHFNIHPVKADVTFTSWLTATDEVMNGLDIVCLSSLNEGTPVSLIEAQAAARPVVTTHAGSVADIVSDGKSGFITPLGDTNAFVAALSRLVNDGRLRSSMGQAGKIQIHTLYHKAHILGQTASLYQEPVSSFPS
jgi:glycosyltransferase involved in cell wall biosynthesis